MSCPAPAPSQGGQTPLASTSSQRARCPRKRHFVSGTFNSPSLHLFSFDTLTRTLSLLSTIPGYGPHSFLTPGRTLSASPAIKADLLYATTWAENRPELCAWRVQWSNDHDTILGLDWLGNVPITATSSYVHAQPPPYDTITAPSYGLEPGPSRYLYSAGGPTGEVHAIDSATGKIQAREQEIIFLREGAKALPQADKTRKALRYGAHNVDVGKGDLAYIADVGRESILAYRRDPMTGTLSLLSEAPMPSNGPDGPRHVIPSPCGKYVYSVTEHTSFVDAWSVQDDASSATLKHLWRTSILPPEAESRPHDYRGDTLRLSPDGRHLFATTRGMHKHIKGFVTGWQLDAGAQETTIPHRVITYETRNSGGKANAIEFAPRYDHDGTMDSSSTAKNSSATSPDYAVLTDDQEGYISVMEWDGTDLRDVATVRLPALENGEPQGASQAVWLS